MPGNAFIKFDKAVDKGESTHETHNGKSGWIEISDWSWDITADTSFLKGAGASVGKPQPESLSFTHYFDTSSPAIMMKIVQGKHFPMVHIVMLKQVGDASGKGQVFFGMTMREAFITKVSSKGAEDGSVSQDVEMVFKSISIAYAPQSTDGGDKAGSLQAQHNFGWDIALMKTEDVDKMDLAVK